MAGNPPPLAIPGSSRGDVRSGTALTARTAPPGRTVGYAALPSARSDVRSASVRTAPVVADPVSVRVMRLQRPRIQQHTLPVYVEPGDPFADSTPQPGYGFATELLLPKAEWLEPMHVGQTFRACIRVRNDSAKAVRNVVVKTDLVSPSRAFCILKNPPIEQLPPGASRDFVVGCPLQEVGDHKLASTVVMHCDGLERTVRPRSISFPIRYALVDSCRSTPSGPEPSHPTLRILKLENNATVPITLASARPIGCTLRGTVDGNAMNPGETQQLLLELAPMQHAAASVHLRWYTEAGEHGESTARIQQQRHPPRARDVEFTRSPEGQVRLQTSFKLKGEFKNNLERALNAVVVLDAERLHPFLFSGPSRVRLPTIQPGESAPVEVELVPLCTGVQGVSGITIRDADFDDKLLWDASPTTCSFWVGK